MRQKLVGLALNAFLYPLPLYADPLSRQLEAAGWRPSGGMEIADYRMSIYTLSSPLSTRALLQSLLPVCGRFDGFQSYSFSQFFYSSAAYQCVLELNTKQTGLLHATLSRIKATGSAPTPRYFEQLWQRLGWVRAWQQCHSENQTSCLIGLRTPSDSTSSSLPQLSRLLRALDWKQQAAGSLPGWRGPGSEGLTAYALPDQHILIYCDPCR